MLPYLMQLACTSNDEIPIRPLLLQQIQRGLLMSQPLENADSPDFGCVIARPELQSKGERRQVLAYLEARLSLAPTLCIIRWSIRSAQHTARESSAQLAYAPAEVRSTDGSTSAPCQDGNGHGRQERG